VAGGDTACVEVVLHLLHAPLRSGEGCLEVMYNVQRGCRVAGRATQQDVVLRKRRGRSTGAGITLGMNVGMLLACSAGALRGVDGVWSAHLLYVKCPPRVRNAPTGVPHGVY
jgi:hypothetical protein